MTQFKNNPEMHSSSGEGLVRRYVHQPLTIEHYGLLAKIQENGHVVIRGVPVKDKNGDMEYDEVEVPASFIFKIVMSLKLTRTVTMVPLAEADKYSDLNEKL